MSKFSCDIDDDFYKMLNTMENVDEIAPTLLSKAVEIVNSRLIGFLSKWSGSEMVRSIKPTKPKKNQYGWYVASRPTGKDSKTKVRNMEKLVYLMYGHDLYVHGKYIKKIPRDRNADISRVSELCEAQVTEEMQKTFNEVIGQWQ